MTTATFAKTDARLFAGIGDADYRPVFGRVARLARRFAKWREINRTAHELRALDVRLREDIGIAGLDMRDVARAAVRNR